MRLDCGVKQWVYTSAATKLCCSGALLCGAVLLCYCSSPLLELQHELLHHGVDPRGDTAGMCANCLAHGVAQVDTARAVSLVWSSKGVNPDGQSNVALYHTDVEPREQKERSDGPRQHRRQHSQRGQGEEQSGEDAHSHCPDSKRHSVSPASSHASPTAIVTYRVGSVFGSPGSRRSG